MASELETLFDGGAPMVPSTPVQDETSDAGRSMRSTRSKASSKAKPAAGRARRGQASTLSSSFTCWKNTPDCYLRDFMEHVEPTKCSRSYLNSLSSKHIRLAFFGIFRKGPNQALDSLDKTVLTDMMAKEYERLGKPLSKDGETLMSIIKRVEIELSRNTTFTIMNLSNGKTMLQCRGIVKELPPAKHGWTIKQAAGSLIPYVVDGESGNKKWCMELFQASENTPESNDTIPELNLDNVVPDDSSPPGAGGESKAPVAPMAGMTPGADSVQKGKSMFAVCYCGFDRAACGACGRGYQQEVSAGRSPKFIECPDGSKPRAAIVGHKDTEYKSKKIPVCKCGTSTPECKKCGEGYVERTLRGEPPLFMEKQVRIKQVAVCACGEPRKTCDVCHLGWVETCQKGNMPTFKDVEVDDEEETSETANKEGVAADEKGPDQKAADPAATVSEGKPEPKAEIEKEATKPITNDNTGDSADATSKGPPEKKQRVEGAVADAKSSPAPKSQLAKAFAGKTK